MTKMKVLIVYVAAGGGHRQAAKAIKRVFQEEYPEVIIREENLFRHGNPFMACSLDSLYYALIKATPWLWDLLWDSKEIYWLTRLLRNILCRLNYHRLYRDVIKSFNPQVVVCTHNLSCAICSVIKHDKKMNYLLMAVPTDFYLNPYWFYKNVDMYFLPKNNLDFEYLKQKIPHHKLQVSGIPISPEFSKSKDKNYLKKKWQLKENLFTVLVMGGGQGLGAIDNIVLALKKSSLPLQVIVVTGTNKKLRENLFKLKSKLDFPFKVCGYVNQVDELMEVSDLLISKPGGLTTAEALSKALPMIIVDSITGQERRNKKLLLEKNLALSLNNTKDLASALNKFINDDFDKNLWRKQVKDIARPNSSRKIVRKIVSMIEERRGKWNI